MSSRMPGPGDPETWGPPTGHPHDPRTVEVLGCCASCGDETDYDVEVDADEDGEFAIFTCERCYHDRDDDEE